MAQSSHSRDSACRYGSAPTEARQRTWLTLPLWEGQRSTHRNSPESSSSEVNDMTCGRCAGAITKAVTRALREFVEEMKHSGLVTDALRRRGTEGATVAPSAQSGS